MIRFEQQNLHAAQMNFDRIRHVAEIGRDADLDAFGVETEPDGIDGIMRNGEALHRNIADHPARACLEMLDREAAPVFRRSVPVDQRRVSRETKTGSGFFFFRAQRMRRGRPET